ncbi:hypothetical protein I552_3350 [Mycobacterium xenopi 3993]|nr:hypothetical protein I552_3350 [Mycobacterium xenopi 3993]
MPQDACHQQRTINRATTVHACSEPRECPAAGSPTVTTIASPTASTAAYTHSHRVTRSWIRRA